MNVLHIASQYTSSRVYRELIEKISQNDIYQYVYVPLRKENLKNKIIIENVKKTKYLYDIVYNKMDRILYYTRIYKATEYLKKKISVNEIDFIHAHTLFADGGIAYKLNKEYGIHYIVAIRSTDTREYLRKMIHCRAYMNKIIKNADYVIFISPTSKKEFEKSLSCKMKKILNEKAIIEPNGISDYWHQNRIERKKASIQPNTTINFIQVSELDKNKNIYASIEAIEILNKNQIKSNLTIIGTGREEDNYKKIVKNKKLERNIFFKGFIKDKKELRKIYNENDIFIMLSKRETFGLVYVEAMSQGKPIIYTRGTGIDQYFEEGHVGFSIDLNNLEEIIEIVKKIIENYEMISEKCIMESKKFNWNRIANDYIKLYRKGM